MTRNAQIKKAIALLETRVSGEGTVRFLSEVTEGCKSYGVCIQLKHNERVLYEGFQKYPRKFIESIAEKFISKQN